MGIFAKFNSNVNKDELRKQIGEAAKNNSGSYKEVPAGIYEGEIEKMELAATKDGRPMLKVQFRITEGEYKKQYRPEGHGTDGQKYVSENTLFTFFLCLRFHPLHLLIFHQYAALLAEADLHVIAALVGFSLSGIPGNLYDFALRCVKDMSS